MEPEITPEPAPAERAAILVALRDQAGDEGVPPDRSRWRQEGVLENVEDEGETG